MEGLTDRLFLCFLVHAMVTKVSNDDHGGRKGSKADSMEEALQTEAEELARKGSKVRRGSKSVERSASKEEAGEADSEGRAGSRL